jgi:hypothetical protein
MENKNEVEKSIIVLDIIEAIEEFLEVSKNLDKTINYSKNPPNWNKILEQIIHNSDDSDEVVIL